MAPERRPELPSEHDPLRTDVGFLGALLGAVLKDQGGDELFDTVEEVRAGTIAWRSGEGGLDAVAERVAGLGLEPARDLVRAFSVYFQLTNLAEQTHRIRRRRAYLADPASPQPGSLLAVVRSLAEEGLAREDVRRLLAGLEITPVFTAHPTEATRRTLLQKEQRIARALVDRIQQPEQTPHEDRRIVDRLRAEATLIWQTSEQPATRPTVADEVEHVLFYLAEVVYRVVPALDDALRGALDTVYGPSGGDDDDVPCPVVRFGSWVGGDMDGNPNVGADTVVATLERQRELALEHYRAEIRHLFEHLSQTESRAGFDDAVRERVEALEAALPEEAERIPARYADMPYRRLLWLMWAMVGAAGGDGGYRGPDALLGDLELLAASLRRNAGRNAGLELVERLHRRVATFGFHLATLDLRQDAELHRDVVATLLGDDGFADRDPVERAERIRRALENPPPAPEDPDGDVARVLGVLRAVAPARERFGKAAIGPHIVSMAHGPDDVLAVLLLARVAGLSDGDGGVPLDVAPLLETVDDLEAAGPILEAMLSDPVYRDHLRRRGDRQLVMIGYSDSAKISGIGASRWALYRAQEVLVEKAEVAGVGLTLFHGRGGTVGRGGSKPRAAILAEPCGAVRGRLRVTEQGEIINGKYGLRGIAERTLELMTGAVLEATAHCEWDAGPRDEWRRAMTTFADASRAAYGELVHDDPDFVPYFRSATPIDVIERMPIGSRPASRRSGAGVEDLRAIPWVFSWMQSRHLLPGWCGVGAGLQAALAEHGREVLAGMAGGWPLFANLLADVSMVLAKADFEIAGRYAALAGDLGERVFPRLRTAFEQTRDAVLTVTGEDDLLEREPLLRQEIALRNPYVDPMSLVQVELLRRWRAADRDDPDLEQALFETVRGIARGLRNTG